MFRNMFILSNWSPWNKSVSCDWIKYLIPPNFPFFVNVCMYFVSVISKVRENVNEKKASERVRLSWFEKLWRYKILINPIKIKASHNLRAVLVSFRFEWLLFGSGFVEPSTASLISLFHLFYAKQKVDILNLANLSVKVKIKSRLDWSYGCKLDFMNI